MRLNSSLALILFARPAWLAHRSQSPTLEERMSQAEFRAAGLDKLSPQELQQLNTWLQSHGGNGTTQYVTSSGAPVFYPNVSDRETIDAHIEGTFAGWRGKTVFKLDNGQEWQQAESGSYDTGKMVSPPCTSSRCFLAAG